jgi:hypothetical protein
MPCFAGTSWRSQGWNTEEEARHVFLLRTLCAENLAQIARVLLIHVFRITVGCFGEHPLADQCRVVVRVAQAFKSLDPGVLNVVEGKIADVAGDTELG